MSISETIQCDLAVIGTGMAGMSAALFAANRGVSVVQIGRPKGILLASGLLDLMGVHPVQENRSWNDPWAAMDALGRDLPEHPYSRLKKEDILSAFGELLPFLHDAGIPYCRRVEQNAKMITSLGTVKTTYCVPKTMWNGVLALENQPKGLIVDFFGLKDFSAGRIVATLRERWPELRAVRVFFPGNAGGKELLAGEITAQILETPESRRKLAQEIKPHIRDARVVGMPSICGMRNSDEVLSELEKEIGIPLFEIPTIPPSVPGLRLKEAFEAGLQAIGVRQFLQEQVLTVNRGDNSELILHLDTKGRKVVVQSQGVILASGRFMGGGLYATRRGIRETLFNLPVFQPGDRKDWHRKELLDSRGHPANQAGLETDDLFRPLNNEGLPAFETVFAAGSILAHQDWMRMKCGSGLAVSTAYASVNAFSKIKEQFK